MKIDGRGGPARDKAFLDLVRGQDCCLCWMEGNVSVGRSEAHHLKFRGHGRMGKKPDDYGAAPLCRRHHDDAEQHRLSSEQVKEMYAEGLRLLIYYVKKTWGPGGTDDI